MSRKSDFVDHEPLRRPRRSDETKSEDFPTRDAQLPSEFERRFHEPDNTAETSASPQRTTIPDERVPQPANVRDSNGALKRGHALSFAGLFIFTFLVFFRPYELSSLTWLSKGALVTAIITLLFFIPTQLGLENKITIRPREVNLIFLLVALALLSVPFALDKLRAWESLVDYLKVVVMFVVMINVVRTEKRLRALLLLIMTVSLILSVSAIDDYRTGNLALGGQRIEGAIGNLFDNPNDLALHLVTFLPIVVGMALGSRFLAGKLIYFAVAVTLLGGIILTFSRGGFVGLMAVVATLVWRLRKRNWIVVAIATIALIILFVVLTPSAYRLRIATTGDQSTTARTDELKRSIYLAIRHPIVGVGMGNFVLYSNREHSTHNSYTQVASELGLPAAAVYILFLVTAFTRVRRIAAPGIVDKEKRSLAFLALGLEAGLIGYMVSSFFASVAFLWYIYYLVGYAICLSRLQETLEVTQPKTTPAQ